MQTALSFNGHALPATDLSANCLCRAYWTVTAWSMHYTKICSKKMWLRKQKDWIKWKLSTFYLIENTKTLFRTNIKQLMQRYCTLIYQLSYLLSTVNFLIPNFGVGLRMAKDGVQCGFNGVKTLRTQDTSDPRHFGTIRLVPKCPDSSALVPSAELSRPQAHISRIS